MDLTTEWFTKNCSTASELQWDWDSLLRRGSRLAATCQNHPHWSDACELDPNTRGRGHQLAHLTPERKVMPCSLWWGERRMEMVSEFSSLTKRFMWEECRRMRMRRREWRREKWSINGKMQGEKQRKWGLGDSFCKFSAKCSYTKKGLWLRVFKLRTDRLL